MLKPTLLALATLVVGTTLQSAERSKQPEKYLIIETPFFDSPSSSIQKQEVMGSFQPGSVRLLKRSGKDYYVRYTHGEQKGQEGWVKFGRALLPGRGTNRQLRLNDLGFDLLNQLDAGTENTAISPQGIWTSLFTLAYGAAGETQEEFLRVLGDDPTSERLKPFISQSLDTTTGLWKKPEIELTSNFQRISNSLDCQVMDTEFNSSAVERINEWINKNTRGNIKEFIQSLPEETRLMITNVSFLEVQWAIDFELDRKQLVKFESPKINSVEIPMLGCKEELAYIDDGELDVQIVQIPYMDSDIVALLAVPRKVSGLSALLEKLSSTKVSQWIKNAQYRPVELKLPEFEVTSHHDQLRFFLEKQGFETAFTDHANFSNLTTSQRVKISEIMQKVTVKVDRKGTLAYQASAVVLVPAGNSDQREAIPVHADKPFFFMVVHRPSHSVLFATTVVTPLNDPGDLGK